MEIFSFFLFIEIASEKDQLFIRLEWFGWGLKMKGLLFKSLYITLDGGGSEAFPLKMIWNSWVHPNMGIFAWKTAWDKILI